MSSQYGNPASGNTAPSSGYWFDDTGNSQYGTKFFTGFPGGIVTDMYLYVAGDGGAVTIRPCIWDGGDNLVWSGSIGVGGGSRAIGGQSWVHVAVPSVYVGVNAALRLGFQTTGDVVWTYGSSGSVNYQRGQASPVNFNSGGTDGSGEMGVYILYTPGTTEADNGSAWAAGVTFAADDGASWHTSGVQLWADDGASWHQIG